MMHNDENHKMKLWIGIQKTRKNVNSEFVFEKNEKRELKKRICFPKAENEKRKAAGQKPGNPPNPGWWPKVKTKKTYNF